MGAAEAQYEMIFKGLYCSFSPVAAMESGWSELVFDGFIGHEVAEELGGFIVKKMELGAKTTALKEAENGFISIFDGGLFSIGDRLSMNGVAVIVVKEENVVVAANGRDNKTTGLIGANLTSDGVAVGVDLMGSMFGAFLKIR